MKISARALHKSYHDADRELTVIKSLTWDLPESGSVAIVGRSGVGKSTLLHLLGGLDTPTSGSILFDGTDLGALRGDDLAVFRGRHVGFIFQFHHLLPEFTALENVAMPLLINGVGEGEAEAEAKRVLESVELGARLHHRPGALSGGEQQRVAIARAVVTRPAVILADEPTGNLDVGTAAAVTNLLLTINRELRNLLVVVTHSAELSESLDVCLEMMPGGDLEIRKNR